MPLHRYTTLKELSDWNGSSFRNSSSLTLSYTCWENSQRSRSTMHFFAILAQPKRPKGQLSLRKWKQRVCHSRGEKKFPFLLPFIVMIQRRIKSEFMCLWKTEFQWKYFFGFNRICGKSTLKWKIFFYNFHEKYDGEYIFHKFSGIQFSIESEFTPGITNSTRILFSMNSVEFLFRGKVCIPSIHIYCTIVDLFSIEFMELNFIFHEVYRTRYSTEFDLPAA